MFNYMLIKKSHNSSQVRLEFNKSRPDLKYGTGPNLKPNLVRKLLNWI